MKNRWFVLALAIVVSGLILIGVAYATAQENPHQPMPMGQQLKVGKKGKITLAQRTKLADRTLRPGTYVVRHRISNGKHFVRLAELEEVKGRYKYKIENKIGEVPCQLESLADKATKTSVTITDEGGVRRITRIEIAGENVAHVF